MEAEERFQYYYGEYSARMQQIAAQNGIPPDEVEDLLQETFLSFYIHYSARVPEEGVRPLLFRIMKNRCIDYWRRKENRISDATSPEQLIRMLSKQSKMVGRDTLDIVLENIFFEDFYEAVRGMREEWKRVYVPYEVMGRPMEEISESLGISENACRMRNLRGRRYLARFLEERDGKISG